MPTQPRPTVVLDGAADPLIKARVLAALLAGPLPGAALGRAVDGAGVPEAVDELVAAGSVRRTADGGLALDPHRRATALEALVRDLRAGAAVPRDPG